MGKKYKIMEIGTATVDDILATKPTAKELLSIEFGSQEERETHQTAINLELYKQIAELKSRLISLERRIGKK